MLNQSSVAESHGSSAFGDGAGQTVFVPGKIGPTPLTPIELYTVVTLLTLMSVFGTAGNILVLWVFRKRKDKLVSTLFIIVLACVDLSTCACIIPYTIYMEIVGFHVRMDAVCKVYQFLITSNIPFSALIMVAIAVDRYLCICHPFLRSVSTRKAKAAVAGLGLCAAGLGLCVSLMYGVYHRTFPPLYLNDLLQRRRDSPVWTTNDTIKTRIQALTPHSAATLSYTDTSNMTPKIAERILCDDIVCRNGIQTTPGNGASRDERRAHQPDGQQQQALMVANYGICAPNDLLLSEDFCWYFQKVYNGLYLVCFVTVVVLYTLIYRSVLERRNRRLKQKRKLQSIVASLGKHRNGESTVMQEMVMMTFETKEPIHHHHHHQQSTRDTICRDQQAPTNNSSMGSKTGRRKSWSLDSNWMANLKTAAMLFVVTVVFIMTYLPAFMMTLYVLPYNVIIFYMYFANNVANPFIYSFMNTNFRDDLRQILCLKSPSSATSF